MSASGETFASWATHVTQCSNPTFNRVVSRMWSNTGLQRDVLAVLSGVTKLIQSRGGCESATEYYAALLSLLNTETNTKTAEAYLLQLVMSKAVPLSLLRKTCDEASKTIVNVLSAALQEEPMDISLCKSLLLSLGRVLIAQPAENWATESVRHTYRMFLRFINHDNSALRKASHKVISDLLTCTVSPEDTYHPTCHQTINHISKLMRHEIVQLSGLIRITDDACCHLLYILNLLRSIICLLPEKDVKLACECVLELTALNNPLVVKSTFECLQTLFEGRVKATVLSLVTSGKLMTALFTCKPRDPTSVDITALHKDSETLIAWLECLCAGVGYLTLIAVEHNDKGSIDSASHVALEHLEHLIHNALNIVISSPFPHLRNSVGNVLVNVLITQLTEQLKVCNLLIRRPRLLPELCLTLQNALNLTRRDSWPNLLNISSHLLHIWGMSVVAAESVEIHLPVEVVGLVQRVANLRDALIDGVPSVVDTGNVSDTTLIDEMDRLILTSMESWGIEPLLSDALPLEPLLLEIESGNVELRRSWILPLIARVHPAHPCSLGFFNSFILPLADRAIKVAKAAAGQSFERQVGGKAGTQFVPLSAILNSAVQMARQLWDTLVAFTRRTPSRWADLVDSGLGGRLIAGLLTAKAVRPTILSALRRLVSFADTEEAVSVMRLGAKQIVPRLLAMYEELDLCNDQQLKQQLQTTLSALLPLLTPKMLSVPCETAYKKFVATRRPIYIDILMLIVPNLTNESIKALLDQLEEYFMPKDQQSRALKKPVYRLLEAIVSSANSSAKEFVVANLTKLTTFMAQIAPPMEVESTSTDHLTSTMAALKLSSKERKALTITTPWKARLRILRHLLRVHVEQHEQEELGDSKSHAVEEFINVFMPEIPQCLGSLNSLVRVLAGRLLVDMVLASAGALSVEKMEEGQKSKCMWPSTTDPLEFSQTDGDEGDVDYGSEGEVEDIEENNVNVDNDQKSLSERSCVPTETASVSTVISITGMDPSTALKICAGLQPILSHLWPVIMEATLENLQNYSQAKLLHLEVTTKSVCRLLSDLKIRRSLMAALLAGESTDTSDAADVLSTANRAAQKLVQLPNQQISRLGLQIARLLIAFLGHTVYVSDIVITIHGIHDAYKHSLRFMVKGMVEKLLKKVSVQALLSLMATEYHKMIRNSAKILRRREQKNKADRLKKGAKSINDYVDKMSASIVEENFSRSRPPSSVSGVSAKSSRIAPSLTRHIHLQNFQEILAASNDDDNHDAASVANHKATAQNSTIGDLKGDGRSHRRLGLATELERAASVAGLSRRSRRSILGGMRNDEAQQSSDDDDEDLDSLTRVSIHDDVTRHRLAGKKRRHGEEVGEAATPMTYLVEDAEDEIVDLADPESLARHLTVAPSAQMAKRILKTEGLDPGNTTSKRARLNSSASAFPTTADGKFVISEAPSQDINDDWLLDVADEDDNGAVNLPYTVGHSVRGSDKLSKRDRMPRLPGAEYRSSRAEGDMRKPGRPDPFAYAPLGAGLPDPRKLGDSAKRRRGGGAAMAAERRALLRCLGAGKQKRKHGKRMGGVTSSNVGRPKAQLVHSSRQTPARQISKRRRK